MEVNSAVEKLQTAANQAGNLVEILSGAGVTPERLNISAADLVALLSATREELSCAGLSTNPRTIAAAADLKSRVQLLTVLAEHAAKYFDAWVQSVAVSVSGYGPDGSTLAGTVRLRAEG